MGCFRWIIFGILFEYALGAMQVFRLTPKDLKVHEGAEAKLECEISNLQGQVQWTKDGFALGFSPKIPGYPRYSYVGDRSNGVYNLLIKNVTLEDDGEFQCQVGPYNFHKEIRANATLTVVSPPSAVEIIAPGLSESKLQINENQSVEIECLVKNAKPAASVVWYRGGVQLKPERSTERIIEVRDRKITRYTVSSKLKLQPTADDDYAEYFCEARHEALPNDMPMRAKVELSVQYPPGRPYIEGYIEGETVRKGQTVELVCRSRGGNPPAQLIWYKNGEQIRMAYRTTARLSENIYTFTAEPSDNKAKYTCEASNIMSATPLKAEITLKVFFAPTQVTISGPTEARSGDQVILSCSTDASNPAADIKWQVGGRQLRNASFDTRPAAGGGFITVSNVTLPVGQKRALIASCYGINMRLTENVVGVHTVNVLYPPGAPVISGYQEQTPIAAGTIQRISCMSTGGNPFATLTWFKNDKKIHSVSKVTEKSVSAELSIVANASDNGAIYKCEASNPATEVPLIESIKMNVLFAPEHVEISKEPSQLKPGDTASLTCEASSSHPPAKLSWWKEGIPVSGVTNESKPGLHGGTVSSIQLKLNVTPELAGTVFTCQATNEALERSVHDAFTLDVLYKPVFEDVPEEVEIGVEGEPLVVSLFAKGNPTNIAYTWSKSGLPLTKKSLRILADGPVLNFTRLSRNDSGVYTCEASNSEGQTLAHVNISVKYPAEIIDSPSYMTVDPGQDATLYCRLSGEPLEEKHVRWRSKAMSDLKSRSTVSLRNSTSILQLRQVSVEDAGPVECVVDNGVGNETFQSIPLLVKFKPEISVTPAKQKAASNIGETAKLYCKTKAVPKPAIKWLRDGHAMSLNSTSKYSIELHEIDLSTFESILTINKIASSDYGKYECEARNEKGLATNTMTLDVTSQPDPPVTLVVENATHDSISLSWTPGFDGGLVTSFQIRYKPKDSNLLSPEGYRYVEVENVTSHVITGLELDTEYIFSIMAFNKLGSSNYLAQTVIGRTTEVPPTSLQSPSLGSPENSHISSVMIAVVAASGIALLALNILLVGCCLRRRRTKRFSALLLPEELLEKVDITRLVIISVSITAALLLSFNILLVMCLVAKKRNKRAAKGSGEQGSNKSATIEMYAPSSYNETVTGETLSSVSEKSENYSNAENNEDYPEDSRKAASTYLIDQIDYPFPPYVPATAYEMQQQQQGSLISSNSNHVGNHVDMPLPMPLKNTNYVGQVNALLAPPHPPLPNTVDGAYYSLQPDSRYVAYPPPLEFSQGSLRRVRGTPAPGAVPPPDVTVLHNPPVLSATLVPHLGHLPPAPLSSFTPTTNLENEGHLV